MPQESDRRRIIIVCLQFLLLMHHVIHQRLPIYHHLLHPPRIQAVQPPVRQLPPRDLYQELWGTQWFTHFVGLNAEAFNYLNIEKTVCLKLLTLIKG